MRAGRDAAFSGVSSGDRHHGGSVPGALPSVRTGLLMWLGGLAPCALTALMTNWYSVSGNNPFRTMELVWMGSRMYVHSVSISGLWKTGEASDSVFLPGAKRV